MAIADTLKERIEGARGRAPAHPRVPPLTVQAILSQRPPVLCQVGPGTAALSALRLMAQCNVAALLVIDGDKVTGVFSEREYRQAAALEEVESIPVGTLMIPCGMTVSPEDSANHCLQICSERQFRYLPVAQGSQVIDLLSLEELLGALAAYYQKIILAFELDQQVMFLRGTYSC